MPAKKPPYILMVALGALVMMTANCSPKKSPPPQTDRVDKPVDDAFRGAKDVLKEVAEGINNAVY